MEDNLVAQRERRVRVTNVVRLNKLRRTERHTEDECPRFGRAGPVRLRRDGNRHRACHAKYRAATAPARGTLCMVSPLPGCPGRPPARSGIPFRTTPDHGRHTSARLSMTWAAGSEFRVT